MRVCLSVCLSVYLSVCLSVCLSVYLSIYLSICLSVCLSVCLVLLQFVTSKYFDSTNNGHVKCHSVSTIYINYKRFRSVELNILPCPSVQGRHSTCRQQFVDVHVAVAPVDAGCSRWYWNTQYYRVDIKHGASLTLSGLEDIFEFFRAGYSCSAQWLLYVQPGLALNNSTFCPQNAFVCSV
jgi:hypothetical protein